MLGPTHRIGGIAAGALITLSIETVLHIQLKDPILFASIAMAGGAIGSLIPDIDSPTSTLGRRIKPVSKAISGTLGHRGGTHTILAWILFSIFTIMVGNELESYLSSSGDLKKLVVFATVNSFIMVSSGLFLLNSMPIKHAKKEVRQYKLYIILVIVAITFYLTKEYNMDMLGYIQVYLLGVNIGYLSHIILDMITREGVPLFRPLFKFKVSLGPFKTGSNIEWITKLFSLIVISISLINIVRCG